MTATTIFGPYEPDKPPHLQDGLSDMSNAYASPNGYRPVGQFQSFTAALPGEFNGATAFVASDGSAALLAGTPDAIYRYSGDAWVALSTGLTVPERWEFTQFGDMAIAVNGTTTTEIDLIANTIVPVPDAPTAAVVATVRDFVVYGQADGNKAMVQWSAFNNQDGNTPGVDQAGFQPMLSGGYVMGIAGGEYGVIIQRSRIVRMTYTGDPDTPFQFDEVATNIGAISRGSIAQSDKLVFFYSDRGFMKFDGSTVTPIGLERVDRTFAKLYARSLLDQMYSAIDPRQSIVAWMMPGNPGLTLLYDWNLDRWSVIRGTFNGMFSGFSANTSLEALDALYPGGVDTIPYSLDDPRFAGGDPLLLIADPSNFVGTLSGANMAAWFQCPFAEYIPGLSARVRNSRPLTDGISGISITLDGRARLGDAQGISTRATLTASGQMPVRMNKRYIAPRLDLAAGVPWTYMQGLSLEVEPGNAR